MVAFVVGGLWYSPLLFHRPWLRASGVDEKVLAKPALRPFVVCLVGALVASEPPSS
ncbi:MAG: DUF1761 family protein [Labilithrix sp.]|nr:DUF1761 family protein [Labilithrix sp.]MCW5812153.1 DUF1761 family protein [Labilithrix sp.]